MNWYLNVHRVCTLLAYINFLLTTFMSRCGTEPISKQNIHMYIYPQIRNNPDL
jgi:hypothetical protein